MFRRLLQRFEEGVKRFFREHMHFVDDVDFETACGGRIFYLFSEIADLVDTAVGSSIDFNDIHRAGSSELYACRTHAAGASVLRILTADSSREYFGQGRLSCSANAGEKISMPDSSRNDLISENSDGRILTGNIFKP